LRIFWLGMHKILVRTELPRLRKMGYEVFNPPYLSPVKDQSANLDWNAEQKTSLPPDVFEKLSQYKFFYNQINPEIADLLNKYFDAIIVTIHCDWLLEILKVFKGKVIFRTYGQTSPLSQLLFDNGAFQLISAHKDFYFAPHASEALEGEHTWLRERAVIIPYCLPEDVFKNRNTYSVTGTKSGTIAVSCPNIKDPHYFCHYQQLKRNLQPETYKIYGVQLQSSADPQVVGTLPPEELTKRFLSSNAYLYTYTHPQTCYLPPIEMMILGGPVVFFRGSLLDKYFHGTPAPGRVASFDEAKDRCQRLLDGDLDLANKIIQSQNKIIERYDPAHVWPVFEREINRMLSELPAAQVSPVCLERNESNKPVVILFHHFPGDCVHFNGIDYSAHDGIPRVMRLVVKALLESGKYTVKVTARKNQVQNFYGFFKSQPSDNLQIICLDDLTSRSVKSLGFLKKLVRYLKNSKRMNSAPIAGSVLQTSTPATSITREQILTPEMSRIDRLLTQWALKNNSFALESFIFSATLLRPIAKFAAPIVKSLMNLKHSARAAGLWYLDQMQRTIDAIEARLGPPLLIKMINNQYPNATGLIPHYHLFPECINLEIKTAMYIPDFTPHFFEATGEFGPHLQESAIGQSLVRKTKTVFTNSLYSKSYLPETRLQVPIEKIKSFYLPNLNVEDTVSENSNEEIAKIKSTLAGGAYLFYPTQPRQNKKLDLLFRVFDSIADERPELKLVLTSELVPNSAFDLEFRKMKARKNVLIFPQVSDGALSWLYKHADVLTFTSAMEGNFPPQVFEALFHRLPVVATRLPLITERLGDKSDQLLLCEAGSFTEFRKAILYCLENKQTVLQNQEPIRERILEQGSATKFNQEVLALFED
jgi:glycosyltransferase involved in cell wall biosynthesis